MAKKTRKERIEPPYWELGIQIKLPEGEVLKSPVPDDAIEIGSIVKKLLSDYFPKGTKLRFFDCHEEVEEEDDQDVFENGDEEEEG